MRREDAHRSLGDLLFGVHEDGAALLELVHDVTVVDDLLADVDGGPAGVESSLDDLDGPVDAGAVAAGRGENDFLHTRHGSGEALPTEVCGPMGTGSGVGQASLSLVA